VFLQELGLTPMGRAIALGWVKAVASPEGDSGGPLSRARGWLLAQLNGPAALARPSKLTDAWQRGCPEVSCCYIWQCLTTRAVALQLSDAHRHDVKCISEPITQCCCSIRGSLLFCYNTAADRRLESPACLDRSTRAAAVALSTRRACWCHPQ
jgi:hypothetical protein